MQVILLERVGKLGKMGDVVTVKPGYARNFLIPQNKAKRATKENVAYFEQERERLEAKNQETKKVAEQLKDRVQSLEAVIIRTSSEKGHLYGSVTTRDISAACKESGADILRTQIDLSTPIKTLGVFQVLVSLHPEVETTIFVNVARSKEEAKAQMHDFLNPKKEKSSKEEKASSAESDKELHEESSVNTPEEGVSEEVSAEEV